MLHLFPFLQFQQKFLLHHGPKIKRRIPSNSDLSNNRLNGRLNGNFTSFKLLIDLYLGYNQIEFIDEFAFNGLERLQVLELNNNFLMQIHSNSFLPLKSNLFDLNLSNNKRLLQFEQINGNLDKLISLKLFGNEQLKIIPKFKSALALAFTYAYHCCDYSDDLSNDGQMASDSVDFLEDRRLQLDQQNNSLLLQLIGSVYHKAKTFLLFPPGEPQQEPKTDKTSKKSPTTIRDDVRADGRMNLTELIFWPTGNGLNWQSKSNESHNMSNLSLPNRRRRKRRQIQNVGSKHGSDIRGLKELDGLIDEIAREMEQIRFLHGINHLVEVDSEHRSTIHHNHKPGSSGGDDRVINSQTKRHLLTASIEDAYQVGDNELRDINRLKTSTSALENNKVSCIPEPNSFLPCKDLFDSWWLRAGIWSVFLLSFTGNILVIIVLGSVRQSSSTSALTSIMWLAHTKRHIDVPRFLVINLAIADLLMALYLGLLAFVDLSTLGEFKIFAIKWQYSNGCKLAGFLGVLSSELSVFILAIITLERNYAITNAVHLNRRLSLQKAMVIMFLGYMFALTMAILPLNGVNSYNRYSICLPLDMNPMNQLSQLYLISLLSINTFSFLLLLSCYLRMYCAIRGSQAWNTNDLRIAKRMSILVITDFLCWMPIIITAISSIFNYRIIGPEGLKVITIFILPLNSVANPFLYAITTKKFKRDLTILNNRVKSSALVKSCGLCQSNYDENDYLKSKNAKLFMNYNKTYRNNLNMTQLQNNSLKGGKKLMNVPRTLDDINYNQRALMSRQQQLHRLATSSKRRQMGVSRPTVAALTIDNQVTINKTSCSCQQPQREIFLDTRQQVTYTNTSDDLQTVKIMPKPKIILEAAIEPALNVALAPCGLLRKSNSIQVEERELDRHENQSWSNQFVVVASQDLQNLRSEASEDLFSTQRDQNGTRLKPIRSVRDSTSSSKRSPSSCHQHKSSQVYLSVSPRQPELANRSASACGYRQEERITSSNRCLDGGSCALHEKKCCSTSHDPMDKSMKHNHVSSKEKLSKSISRFLFSPIVKAWSSIHISLSSNAISRSQGCEPQLHYSPKSKLKEEEQEIDDLLSDNNNAPTIDDILLMSPASRLLKASERRMSKSCDMITSHQNPSILASPTQSSSGNNHDYTTTTTLGTSSDYDDDRRVLLATIHRIASNRPTRFNDRTDSTAATSGQYLRSRCTRCRSWSPALLSKLEDCFNQIKYKIPGFNPPTMSRSQFKRSNPLQEQSSSCQQNENDDQAQADSESENQLQFNYEDDEVPVDSERANYLVCGHEEVYDDDDDDDAGLNEDEFNEDDIDWENRRTNMMRLDHFRKRFGKSKQQSSITSDTLSTKTAGTVMTNVSESFESSNANDDLDCPQVDRSG